MKKYRVKRGELFGVRRSNRILFGTAVLILVVYGVVYLLHKFGLISQDKDPHYFFSMMVMSFCLSVVLVMKDAKRKKKNHFTIDNFIVCANIECKKSIEVEYDWQCQWCDMRQGEKRNMYLPCTHCSREQISIFCSSCESEMELIP